MGSETFRICDRCSARHLVDKTLGHRNPVRQASWTIPYKDLGGEKPTEVDLCQPCRDDLATMLKTFMKP